MRPQYELGPEHNGFLTPGLGGPFAVSVVWVGDRTQFPWGTYAAADPADHLSYWALEGWPAQLTLHVRDVPPPPAPPGLAAFWNTGFAPALPRPAGVPIDPASGDRWYRVVAGIQGVPLPDEIYLQVRAQTPARLTWYRRGEGGPSFWGSEPAPGRSLTFTQEPRPASLPPGVWSVTVEDQVAL